MHCTSNGERFLKKRRKKVRGESCNFHFLTEPSSTGETLTATLILLIYPSRVIFCICSIGC